MTAGSADTRSLRARPRGGHPAVAQARSTPTTTDRMGSEGTADDFDALLFSGNSGAGTPAKAGYPSIVVPGGFFVNADADFPADFNPLPGPAGVTFSGRAFSEPQLDRACLCVRTGDALPASRRRPRRRCRATQSPATNASLYRGPGLITRPASLRTRASGQRTERDTGRAPTSPASLNSISRLPLGQQADCRSVPRGECS